jgi:C4-type Zn-finger protein
MSDKLRECPFCKCNKLGVWKGDSEIYMMREEIISYVFCKNCGCQGPTRKTKKAAKEAWNIRYKSYHLLGYKIRKDGTPGTKLVNVYNVKE